MLVVGVALIHAIGDHPDCQKLLVEALLSQGLQPALVHMVGQHRRVFVYPFQQFLSLVPLLPLPLIIHLSLHLIYELQLLFQLFGPLLRCFELEQPVGFFYSLGKGS